MLPFTPREIIEKSVGNNWFSRALEAQTTTLFSRSFLSTLKSSFLANISLLSVSNELINQRDIFISILEVYRKSFDLYQDQINFNASVQEQLLGSAENKYYSLLNLSSAIESCGNKLDNKTQINRFLNLVNETNNDYLENDLAVNESLDKSITEFILKVDDETIPLIS